MIGRCAALWSLAAIAAGALCAPQVAAAQRRREVIERVAAVVNDEAIFLSELRRRATPFLHQALSTSSEVERMARIEQIYSQLLDALVDEELIQQAARRMQVRVTTPDVERAIENVRRQSGLSESEFWEAVRGQGFTESQYRSDVRRQLLRLKVLNSRVRGRVNVTDEQVRARYAQLVLQTDVGTCFEASMLVFRVAQDAESTEVAARREEAEAASAGLTAATFAAAGAVDLGRICAGELSPQLEQALGDLRPGQISPPVRTPAGFVVLHVRGRAQEARVPPYEQARADISRQLLEEAMQRQERIFIDQLRREAVIQRRLNDEG